MTCYWKQKPDLILQELDDIDDFPDCFTFGNTESGFSESLQNSISTKGKEKLTDEHDLSLEEVPKMDYTNKEAEFEKAQFGSKRSMMYKHRFLGLLYWKPMGAEKRERSTMPDTRSHSISKSQISQRFKSFFAGTASRDQLCIRKDSKFDRIKMRLHHQKPTIVREILSQTATGTTSKAQVPTKSPTFTNSSFDFSGESHITVYHDDVVEMTDNVQILSSFKESFLDTSTTSTQTQNHPGVQRETSSGSAGSSQVQMSDGASFGMNLTPISSVRRSRSARWSRSFRKTLHESPSRSRSKTPATSMTNSIVAPSLKSQYSRSFRGSVRVLKFSEK